MTRSGVYVRNVFDKQSNEVGDTGRKKNGNSSNGNIEFGGELVNFQCIIVYMTSFTIFILTDYESLSLVSYDSEDEPSNKMGAYSFFSCCHLCVYILILV